MSIDDFIERLANYKSNDTVFNMYRGNPVAAKKCRKNLREYLEKHKNSQILFVGEAPGYKGCAKTGVPFTSDSGEISSKVLRGAIEKYSSNTDILMWNAFPFHPHKKGERKSNRKPSKAEVQSAGWMIMNYFLEVFPNIKCVASVGNVAKELLQQFEFEYKPSHICHPSYGHKKQCEEDTYRALSRFSNILLDERIMRSVADCVEEEYKEAAYHYLKEHKKEFFDWYGLSDHMEYAHAYLLGNKDINLSEYQKWPEKISTEKNAEYLDKVRPEYITRVVCERDDPYYDTSASIWTMKVYLKVHGWNAMATIEDTSPWYKKILGVVEKSDDFVHKSIGDYSEEEGFWYGRFSYTRKNEKI